MSILFCTFVVEKETKTTHKTPRPGRAPKTMRTYKAEAYNRELHTMTTLIENVSEIEALNAIEAAIDEDLEYGEYETYDYYLNGQLMTD